MALLHVDFFSEVLEKSMNMDVILPQNTTSQIGMKGNAGRRENTRPSICSTA